MSPYSENERKIFPYRLSECGAEVFGDPLALSRELSILLDGDPNGVIRAARGTQERDANGKIIAGQPSEKPEEVVVRLQAERRLLAAVREAFGMDPFDRATGQGATDEDCRRALNCYLEWQEKNGSRAVS